MVFQTCYIERFFDVGEMAQQDYHCLSVERQGALAIVKIDCPPANAFTTELVGELNSVVDNISRDKSYRGLVIASEHKTIFLSGGDIKFSIGKLESNDVQGEIDYVRSIQRVISKIEQMAMPVVCCINGHALGGGFEFAIGCDFRYLAEEAVVGIPEIKLGFMPAVGGLQRIARKFGQQLALKMGLGLKLKAHEALNLGLVDQVYPKASVLKESIAYGHILVQLPTQAVAMIKESIYEGFNKQMPEALELELDCLHKVANTADAQEGLRAYLEKRRPVFRGE